MPKLLYRRTLNTFLKNAETNLLSVWNLVTWLFLQKFTTALIHFGKTLWKSDCNRCHYQETYNYRQVHLGKPCLSNVRISAATKPGNALVWVVITMIIVRIWHHTRNLAPLYHSSMPCNVHDTHIQHLLVSTIWNFWRNSFHAIAIFTFVVHWLLNSPCNLEPVETLLIKVLRNSSWHFWNFAPLKVVPSSWTEPFFRIIRF